MGVKRHMQLTQYYSPEYSICQEREKEAAAKKKQCRSTGAGTKVARKAKKEVANGRPPEGRDLSLSKLSQAVGDAAQKVKRDLDEDASQKQKVQAQAY